MRLATMPVVGTPQPAAYASEIELRCGFYWVATWPHTAARERRPTQLRIKRPARRSPVRAFLESVNLVTSASLDRSKLAGTKGLQSWTSSGSAAVLHLPVPETERLAGGQAAI